MKIRAFGLVSLMVSAFALGGCSSKTDAKSGTTAAPATRTGNAQTLGVRGKTKAGPGKTVVARKLAAKGDKTKPVTATVGASGEFELNLPRGARYIVEFVENGKVTGGLRFGQAKGDNVIPAPTVKGEEVPELQGDLDIGELAETAGTLMAAMDILDLVDWDGDGQSDRDDDDDDGDGISDSDDEDDDGDGIADNEEDFDLDDDGVPDDLDEDDDGDGVSDAEDDDDDGDGVSDAEDDDDDNDGIPDAEEAEGFDGEGVPEDEDNP